MSETHKIRDLYGRLQEDNFRKSTDFTEEMELAQKVLFSTYSRFVDQRDITSWWIQRHQSCIFGQIAAAKGLIHYCFITDQDLQRSDQFIGQKIADALLQWKRRSYRPTANFSVPAHGFMLMVVSEHVARAAPDNCLLDFANEFLRLLSLDGTGPVHWQNLYLKEPESDSCLKFTFTIDYFGAQGDGRWWRDHRVPGGIAFSANSVGHMIWYEGWYNGRPKKADWALRLAMETIADSAKTEFGRATWLKSLAKDGKPVVERLASPFPQPDAVSVKIRGHDWTRYAGFLHTDHSIRPEFFQLSASPGGLDFSAHQQDFTYLYDPTQRDHVRFVAGERISAAEVEAIIGPPEVYTALETPPIQTDSSIDDRPTEIREVFERCTGWQIDSTKIDEFLR